MLRQIRQPSSHSDSVTLGGIGRAVFPSPPLFFSLHSGPRRRVNDVIDVVITLPRIGSSFPHSTFARAFPSIYPHGWAGMHGLLDVLP